MEKITNGEFNEAVDDIAQIPCNKNYLLDVERSAIMPKLSEKWICSIRWM